MLQDSRICVLYQVLIFEFPFPLAVTHFGRAGKDSFYESLHNISIESVVWQTHTFSFNEELAHISVFMLLISTLMFPVLRYIHPHFCPYSMFLDDLS